MPPGTSVTIPLRTVRHTSKKAELEGLDDSYEEVRGEMAAAIAEADSAIATVSAELGPLEEAEAVRERSLELNRHVMYGGADKLAECGDGIGKKAGPPFPLSLQRPIA